jgi:hypothetical protein
VQECDEVIHLIPEKTVHQRVRLQAGWREYILCLLPLVCVLAAHSLLLACRPQRPRLCTPRSGHGLLSLLIFCFC